ncbi:hypothetical protein HNQ07_001034 [Deinococcus metalli]|nr:hypothetical protein [Deinococcus metalli]MBB5375590.1 hypothetical protein [Deinococcus metalli]
MTPAELLDFLAARGGQEYEVQALLHAGRGRKASVRELGAYRLTMRGDEVLACGPSGQPRHLSRTEFHAVFGSYAFGEPRPTGTFTDLGPLFGM